MTMEDETIPSSSAASSSFSSRIRQIGNTRQGLVTVLQAIATPADDTAVVLDFAYLEASAYLASLHFNARSNQVIPDLSERLEGCDFFLSYEHRDTVFSGFRAVDQFVEAVLPPDSSTNNRRKLKQQFRVGSSPQNATSGAMSSEPEAIPNRASVRGARPSFTATDLSNVSNATRPASAYNGESLGRRRRRRAQSASSVGERPQEPFGILGGLTSGVSQTLSIMGTTLEIPQISGTATSTFLDKDTPFFARTVPTNQADARAIIAYLNVVGVTHLAILHIRDPWGNLYYDALENEAKKGGIETTAVAYSLGQEDLAIEQLVASEYRYVFAAIPPGEWVAPIRSAYAHGIIGRPGYTWFCAELLEWTNPNFVLDRETDADLAVALNGISSVLIDVETNQGFDEAIADLISNETSRQEWISLHAESEHFEAIPDFPPPGISFYNYMIYDAMMAFGITACELPGLFLGNEFMEKLVQVEFNGCSGKVTLDSLGNRLAESVNYRIINVLLSQNKSTETHFGFTAETSAVVSSEVTVLRPYVYWDNTTTPHASLPPLEQELNLISPVIRAIGLGLGGVVLFASVFWASWTVYHRNSFAVQAAQPVFLCQLCLGTFIMGLAVIPLSLEEPYEYLDSACMSTQWFIYIGFAIAFSALFAKSWRVNRLMNKSRGLQRVHVKAKDVLMPFTFIMTVNISLLTCWTIFDPIRWDREDVENYNKFGQSVESYGACRQPYGSSLYLFFLVPLIVVNFTGVVFSAYQVYESRELPTALAETSYLAISLGSIIETLIMGAPILLAVRDNPSVYFLTNSSVIFIVCLTILGPMFVPKHVMLDYEPSGRMKASIMRASTASHRERNTVIAIRSAAEPDFTMDARGIMTIRRTPGLPSKHSSKATNTSAAFSDMSGKHNPKTVQFAD